MKRVLQLCMLCLAALCAGQALAQVYPQKPVRLVVPFPAGTPKAIIDRLNADLVKVMNSPEIHERMTTLGWDPVTSTPEQFSAQIRSELAIWADVVKKSGARID